MLLAKKRKRKKRTYNSKSKGHRQVSKIFRKLGYTVVDEFCLENSPYDLYVKELNLIVEYYGDRWHYPKDVYPADFWDKVKKQYVWEKWEKDEYKINVAKDKGYFVEVIWENKWKNLTDKTRFIQKIANNLKE